MSRKYSAIAGLFAASLFSACAASPEKGELDPSDARFACSTEHRRLSCDVQERRFLQQQAELDWLKIDNAEADADKALAAGDHSLLGLVGYSVLVPDLPEIDQGLIRTACGVRPVKGSWEISASADLDAAIRKYTRRYNARVLEVSRCLSPDGQPSQPPKTR